MAAPIRAFPWAKLVLVACLAVAAKMVSAALRGDPPTAWMAISLVLAIVGTLAGGIFFARLGLFARPIIAADPRGCAGRLALTFDDGPQASSTRAILDLLDAGGHRATFFVIGRAAAAEPALLREISVRGHALANHSFAHSHGTPFLSPGVLAAELERAEAQLAEARVPPGTRGRWFRAPIGIISPRVAAAAEQVGLDLVSWTVSAWDGTGGATVESALRRLRRGLRPGAILVLHDGAERGDREPIAPAVLMRLLDDLRERGLRSVTLDELLDA